VNRHKQPTIRRLLPALAVLAAIAIPFPFASAQDLDSDDEEIFILELDDAQNVQASDDAVTTLAPIRVEENLPHDLGSGSFQESLSLQGQADFSHALEESPLALGDPSSKGQRKVLLRGFDIRQIAFQFEEMPLDTGYDAIISLDAIPINWMGSLNIKTANTGVFDDLSMGASIEVGAIRPALFETTLGLKRRGFSLSAAHASGYGPYTWAATAGYDYSDGWDMASGCKPTRYEDCGLRNNSDKKSGNVFASVSRKISDWGELTVMGGFNRMERGVVIGVGTAVPRIWRFPRHDVGFGLARLNIATQHGYARLQAWTNFQGSTIEVYDDVSYSTQLLESSHTSIMHDIDSGLLILGGTRPFSWGKLGFADIRLRSELRYQYHNGRDTRLGVTSYDGKTDRIVFKVKPGLYWKALHNLELFADAAFIVNSELSKPQESVINVPLTNRYNGTFSVGLNYQAIPEKLKLSLRVARRLRMPTLKEQFVQVLDAANVRYKDLNAEYNWDFQAQIQYNPLETLQFALTGYDSEVRDLIQFTYIDNLRQALNLDRARMAGLIFLARIGPFYGLSLESSYHYTYTRDLKEERELLERPAHNLRAAAQYKIAGLTLGVSAQYESSRLSDDWTGRGYRRLGHIFLLGAFAQYQLPYVTLSLRANNLLDMHYQRAFGYPEEGRNFFFMAKISTSK